MSSSLSWRRLGALTLAAALLAGCGSTDSDDTSGEAADTRVFAADNGDITIPIEPERVVATGYAVPALIEADAELVGISTWERGLALMTEEDKATYDDLDKVAGESADETNYEAIGEADPDLIIIGVPVPALVDIDMDRLESIAPVVVLGPSTPDAWRELSERQADAAGQLENFEAARDAYDERAAELKKKYADALDGMDFGHVGSYGDVEAGTFQREFAGSWGTNIAQDIGATYYGEVAKKGGGGLDVSEYPSIEQLGESLGDAEAITYSMEPDGSVSEPVQYVLDSGVWDSLPAVKAGKVFPIRYSLAATYPSAMLTLDALDEAFAPLLKK